ncbi:MAG TPA: DUF2786 domain-containing protein [Mycobacteriales bacterium]|nr:DUF2786 domain-containing protein [Mycobacteriales bacterium]
MTSPDRTLARIRALLAKAEHPSTPPPEAEAMSEKAAELMARYAIDQALVDAVSPTGAVPVGRHIAVPTPYAVPKVMLLAGVASAYRVRAVVTRDACGEGRTCTLVGFESDLALVELLFTSLLLQAGTAMRQASEGQRRVRAFRHAFLMGYAGAVTRRVTAAQQRTVDADLSRGAGATSAEVVLADRRDAVDRAVGEMFPRLGRLRTSVSEGGGLAAGHAAGARADLSSGARAIGGRPLS